MRSVRLQPDQEIVDSLEALAKISDLVPEPYLSALGTLHDQVPPVSATIARTSPDKEPRYPPFG